VGWCRECAKLYRMDARAEDRVPAAFDIDMPALIAERGADHSIIRMAPVPCPYCGSCDTETRLSTPPHRDTTRAGLFLSQGITLRDEPHAKRD
jgi:hypothetical protein